MYGLTARHFPYRRDSASLSFRLRDDIGKRRMLPDSFPP